MNHIAIAGNLGLDASLKYTTSGKPVTNLFILVDNGYGANKKSAFGFGVVAWDDLAESAGKLTDVAPCVLTKPSPFEPLTPYSNAPRICWKIP